MARSYVWLAEVTTENTENDVIGVYSSRRKAKAAIKGYFGIDGRAKWDDSEFSSQLEIGYEDERFTANDGASAVRRPVE